MTQGPLARAVAFVVLGTGLVLLASMSADAACLRNDAGRTLYATIQSSAGRIEQNIRAGEEICQRVSSRTMVIVNVMPFGGARFGCRAEMKGDEKLTLTHFGTMNKCRFSR